MLFYNFFVTKLNKKIHITLKNELELEGILVSIDSFLNMRLDNIQIFNVDKFPGINGIKICSVRGSSIKFAKISFDENSAYSLELATRYRFIKDK